MNKIYIKSVIILLSLGLMYSGCTEDFEEINTNPNAPTKDQIANPGPLLLEVFRGVSNNHYDVSTNEALILADYKERQWLSTFGWPASFYSFCWGFYDQFRNLYTCLELAQENGLQNYEGVCLVLKSLMFQILTDLYGDIPYSEAIGAKSDGINFPAYDTQESIYAGILADLEQANNLLDPNGGVVLGDILYYSDIEKWKKFANSLRMRCLLRISDRVDPATEMSRIVNDPTTYPLFEDYEDQAAQQWLEDFPNQFPDYQRRAGDYTRHITVNFLTHLQDMNDPRVPLFAQPTQASVDAGGELVYAGVPNGIYNETNYNGGKKYQSLWGLLWTPLSDYGELASPTAAQSFYMTYSELQFILAEAVERGYISGDAETYYLNGINAHFEYFSGRIPSNYSLPTAEDLIPDASYFTQSNVAYTGTQQERLEKIWEQKWISLCLSGYEGWSHWRRTGYPTIVPGVTSEGYIPRRIIYPLSEQQVNKDNYDAAIAVQGPDTDETRVWWDVD